MEPIDCAKIPVNSEMYSAKAGSLYLGNTHEKIQNYCPPEEEGNAL
jgi:hypothetical protein